MKKSVSIIDESVSIVVSDALLYSVDDLQLAFLDNIFDVL